MKILGIIGGKGMMGRFFAEFFKKQGFRVLIADRKTLLSNKKLVQLSDIIIISVPIHVTRKVIREIIPYIKKNQLLIDVTSLKVFPIKEMLKGKANVIGLHPMFRPGSSGFQDQTIVMSAVRSTPQQKQWLKKLFEKAGASVVEMKPEKHDHLMAIVQVLVHFHSLIFGQTLRHLKINLRDVLKVMSPVYRIQFDIVCRIFAQDPLLYAAISMENHETKKITRAFLQESANLRKMLLAKNMSGFVKYFKKTTRFLGTFSKKALQESDRLIANFRKM